MYLKFHTVVFDTKPHKANKNQRKKKKKRLSIFLIKGKDENLQRHALLQMSF